MKKFLVKLLEKLLQEKDNINSKGDLLLVDTCYLSKLTKKRIDEVLRFEKVVIPSPVLGELKNKKDDKKSYLIRHINHLIDEYKCRLEVADDSIKLDPSWARNADYYIICVGIKLIRAGYNVSLLTEDMQLVNMARAYGVLRGSFEFIGEDVQDEVIENIPVKVEECQKTEEIEIPEKPELEEDKKVEAEIQKKYPAEHYEKIIFQSLVITKGECDLYYLEEYLNVESELDFWKVVIDKNGNTKARHNLLGTKKYLLYTRDEIILFQIRNSILYFYIGVVTNEGTFKLRKKGKIKNKEDIEKLKEKYHKVMIAAISKLETAA